MIESIPQDLTPIESNPSNFEDLSAKVYFSDGTVSTVAKENRLNALIEARGRIYNADPIIKASMINYLARPYTVTAEQIALGIQNRANAMDEEIRMLMPTGCI